MKFGTRRSTLLCAYSAFHWVSSLRIIALVENHTITMITERDEGYLGFVLLLEPLERAAAGAPNCVVARQVVVTSAARLGTAPNGGERCEDLPQDLGKHRQVRVDKSQQGHQR